MNIQLGVAAVGKSDSLGKPLGKADGGGNCSLHSKPTFKNQDFRTFSLSRKALSVLTANLSVRCVQVFNVGRIFL